MSSHAYVLYLVAIKPYQSPLLNNYVLSNETFYSALIIAIFIFSDATPELNIKFAAGVVLISSVFLLIFANLVMIIVLMCKGPEKLKEEIKQAKLKRAEKELMEEEEEEERRQRQQREEEEFTRLPEDTTNMNHYDLQSQTNADSVATADMLKGSKKRKGKNKNKNKNDNDEVSEFTSGVTLGNTTSEMGNTTQGMLNDTAEPLKGKKKKEKKKKKKDKSKHKQDEVAEANIDGQAALVSLPQLLPRTKSLEAPSPSRLMAPAVALGLLQLLIQTKTKIRKRLSQRKRRRRTTQMATPTMKETMIFSEDL